MIIIVFGLPGSGKSYFAKRLAEKLKAEYLNSDQLRLQLIATRKYTKEEKMLVYDTMLTAMEAAVSANKTVVLDGTFYTRHIRNIFEQAADKLNEQIVYIEITAAESIIKERVSKPRPFSEAGYDVYLKLKKEAEPLEKDHLVLNSDNSNIANMLQEALQHIKTRS